MTTTADNDNPVLSKLARENGAPAVIDVWAQIANPRFSQQAWLKPLLRWTGRDALPPSTVAETVAAMDAGGVDLALISAWSAPTGWLIENGEVADQVAAAPDRLRGLAAVDLARPMEAAREVRRCAEQGFVGVRVVPWLWDLPPNDRRYYPVYAACVEAGLPFCTQIGHTGPLMRSETGRLIPYLEDVLLDFPELTVVGGHLGFPWIDELTTLAIKFPNFYVDTSAYAVRRLPASFRAFMAGPGRGRVMFGTNYPMLDPADCLRGLEALGLEDAEYASFLGGAARRAFSL